MGHGLQVRRLTASLSFVSYASRHLTKGASDDCHNRPSLFSICSSFLAKPQSYGAQPLGLMSSHQSSHQGVQARPAHPLSPNFARHLRLTNHAALRCQEMGRGGGGAAGRTVKTRIVHTSVRRPAHHTPRPQNLHSDPDLQIRKPCGVRGRGGAGCGAPGRTLKRVL